MSGIGFVLQGKLGLILFITTIYLIFRTVHWSKNSHVVLLLYYIILFPHRLKTI